MRGYWVLLPPLLVPSAFAPYEHRFTCSMNHPTSPGGLNTAHSLKLTVRPVLTTNWGKLPQDWRNRCSLPSLPPSHILGQAQTGRVSHIKPAGISVFPVPCEHTHKPFFIEVLFTATFQIRRDVTPDSAVSLRLWGHRACPSRPTLRKLIEWFQNVLILG